MKICFAGMGSIAKRHIRNLHAVCLEKDLIIDVLRHEKKAVCSDYKIHHVYYSLEEIPEDYDVIFVTNPTNLHYSTLQYLCKKGRHFFIEKPVFDRADYNFDQLLFRKDSICYVACPMRYTKTIQYLKQNIDFSKVYSIRCISSSYLPDWRPDTDYRKTYSAKRELGGGVDIDLIHEWDYLQFLIGFPQEVYSVCARVSNLEIDSNDIAVYIARYPDKLAEIHLDYFGRSPVRKMEIYTDQDTIIADLLNGQVTFLKEQKIFSFSEQRDDYQRKELTHFFNIINRVADNENTIEKAVQVLKLAGR